MPKTFALDAHSKEDRIFGPQRYGASFGDPIDIYSGAYNFTSTDLTVHGRELNFTFTREYNSADAYYEPDGSSVMGPGWRHSYWWEITGTMYTSDPCASGTLVRGDGTRGRIVTNGTDGDFSGCTTVSGVPTVTMRDQTSYVFGTRYDYAGDPTGTYSLFLLTAIQRPSGNQLTFAYAPSPISGTGYQPVMTTITDTVGRVYRLGYDSAAHLTGITDPNGRTLAFGYDSSGRLTSATDPAGATTRYAYDSTRHITTNTDPDGRVRATNAYDLYGTVIQQTDGAGNVTTRQPLSGGYSFNVTDPRGLISTYNYCTCGTGLTQLRDWPAGYGNSPYYDTLHGYDSFGNRNRVQDRLGNVTTMTYETRAHANLLSRSDPAVAGGTPVTSYQYDSKNNLVHIADPRGFTTDRTYDATTNVLLSERRQIDPSTYATTTYSYGDAANPALPTSITSPRGSVTTLAYDGSGDLTRKTDADGYATAYAYDALGRQTSTTDGDGHTTSTAYDNDDRVTAVTDGLLHVTRYTYDGAGNKTTVTDRDGNITAYAYDGAAQLASVQQHPAPGVTYTTSLTRDGNGNVTRITEGNGVVRDSAYDLFNKVTSTTEYVPQGTMTTTYARDVIGNVLTKTYPTYPPPPAPPPSVPVFHAQSGASNGAGTTSLSVPRPAGAQAGDLLLAFVYIQQAGATISGPSGWTGIGAVQSGSFFQGAVFYHLTAAGDPASWSWTFGQTWGGPDDPQWYPNTAPANGTIVAYGNVNQSTPISPANAGTNSGQTSTVTANYAVLGYANEMAVAGYGQFVSSTDPTPSGWTTRVASGQSSAGVLKVEERQYSAAQATDLVQWSGAGSQPWVAFTVGVNPVPTPPPPPPPTPTVISYGYDALYRLTSVSASGLATISYGYDLAGNRTSMSDGTGSTTYSYDGAGRLTSVAAPNGPLTYAYDLDGNRTSVAYPSAGNVAYTYTAAGRLATLSDWAARRTTYAYRPSGLVQSVTYPNGMLASYVYDAASRLTQLTNAIGATTITSHTYTLDPEGNRTGLSEFVSGITAPGGTDTLTYTYDGLNRLTGSSGVLAETFAYDGASNLTGRTGPSAAYSNDGADRVTSDGSRTFTWSAEDHLTGRGSDTFAYDALDRLTSATVSGTATTYAYSGDGLLSSRGSTAYLWDRSRDPAPLLVSGSDRIVHGLGPLYVIHGDSTTTTLARDGLGSVRAEVSDAGGVTRSTRYAAYGAVTVSSGSSATALGFAGELSDASGLIYLRARWYDPTPGRFITRDPLSPSFGGTRQWSSFGYANGNPTVFADPSGSASSARTDEGGCTAVLECGVAGAVGIGQGQFVSAGLEGSANVGAGIGPVGTYVTFQVGIWYTPSGWVATATKGSGPMTGATIGIALQPALSTAKSGGDLGGQFDQRGFSAGELLQVSVDYATGAAGVKVVSIGPGVTGKFPPLEFHSVTTTTTWQQILP